MFPAKLVAAIVAFPRNLTLSAFLLIIFGPRKIAPALKELASKDSHKVWSQANIFIGEDSLDKTHTAKTFYAHGARPQDRLSSKQGGRVH